ncbi:helix-turn-helix domain-containing protein [Paenibacillus rhizovicinus]|uniref:Helix-turn-helix domain-containing protein n=1 Tax=Paenibacillus rhizovicinus TaxID=2704463 RepID=A0A6C0NZL5_9BACL|nr:helix-turn-helix domain-containing protein [Paenibacillus rhizovicinus]QHW31710.1 helix-turn-helix domain-containing protein [Paenibacillus rhizovicinus]
MQYNLLVVDDEEIAVRGITEGIDWSGLPLARILSALDAEEAKQIFNEQPIHVMISDIDMPMENGIQLLKWVNAHSPATKTIFLTGHADFRFAQQAVQLNSFDYLLKPIDHEMLKSCVEQALSAVREREHEDAVNQSYAYYYDQWNRQLPLLVERMWQNILQGRSFTTRELEANFSLYGLPLDTSKQVLPILVSVEEWKVEWNARDEEIMAYAIKNAAEEMLLGGRPGHVVQDGSGLIFALLYAPDSDPDNSSVEADTDREAGNGPSGALAASDADANAPVFSARGGSSDAGRAQTLPERAAEFIRMSSQYLYAIVSCYIGEAVPVADLRQAALQLAELERANISRTGGVFRSTGSKEPKKCGVPQPNLQEWSALAEAGRLKELEGRIEDQFLLLQHDQPDHAYLIHYYYGAVNAIFQLLQRRGLSAGELYPSDDWRGDDQLTKSLPAMKHWTLQWFGRAAAYFGVREKEASVTMNKVKRFMEAHLHEEMNREEIAGHVHLNPAYLSRLFRRETGQSLTEYLVDMRMRKAQQELIETDAKISDIALGVGYCNFSHFSKQFKKATGLTPQEYRRGIGAALD